MRLLWILSHFPAEGGLRSSTVVSDLSERVMNLTNAHNSLMTSGFCSLVFCCPADGMCRMRAHKWTRQELTLDITGGGFDPGRSGSGKEQDSAGPGRRERVFWSPQDGSGLSGIVSDLIAGEGTDAAAQNGAVFMCHPPCPAGTCELFPGAILGAGTVPTLFSTLFKSFLERNFGALRFLFVHFIICRFLNPHRHKAVCLQIPAKYQPL